ncbi:sulfotransferase domain-containing protein [Ekhidna sp.]|uniref:sulfotransferase domain-containing protein n=1 Tax=Ekhidna sp. TaxID=2608089 RepID=UPI003514E3C3
MRKEKIDLMIVGAQKAGTTSLKNYLMQHSMVAGHETIEFSYFANPQEYQNGIERAFKLHFGAISTQQKVIAKNVTLSLSEDSLIRLQKFNPNIKIVYLIRNPTTRAYSGYNMAFRDGWIRRPFSDILDLIQTGRSDDIMYRHFIEPGLYAKQLKTILKYFPAENISLYLFEDLVDKPTVICQHIFKILGLDDHIIQNGVHNKTYVSKSPFLTKCILTLSQPDNKVKKVLKHIFPYPIFLSLKKRLLNFNKTEKAFPPMDNHLEKELNTFYRLHNEKLRGLLRKTKGIRFMASEKNNWLLDERKY